MKHLSFAAILLFFAGIGFAQTVPLYVPTDSLKAWYAFDSSAFDSSGKGNNGTVIGATAVKNRLGKVHGAYFFDGISNSIQVPPSTSLNIVSDISVAVWVKAEFTDGIIYFRGDMRSSYDPYILYVTFGNVTFGRNRGTGFPFDKVSFPTSIIDTTKFHLLVATYSATDDSMKLYLDGQLKASDYLPGAISYFTDSAHNTIGACDYGTWQFFKGTIDDIGTWNKRLDQCEISSLYYSAASLITSSPSDYSGPFGGTATFKITDTGGTATYQWQENSGTGYVNITPSGVYSGVYTKTLTVTPVSSSMCNHQFRCMRTGITCTGASQPGKVMCPTGITNINPANEKSYITLYPNPNDGSFAISGILNSGKNESVSLEICNVLGQVLYSKNIVISDNIINEQFSLRGLLLTGTYILRLHSESDSKATVIVVN